jgi:hypothetical protein
MAIRTESNLMRRVTAKTLKNESVPPMTTDSRVPENELAQLLPGEFMARCYLCERPLLDGEEYQLACEKGPNITVCEDCYDEALSEELHDRETW